MPPRDAPTIESLETMRRRLGAWSLRMCAAAGSGHPSTCLSASHLVTGLFFGGYLRYDVARPDWPDRDRFVLSKGHAAPILYAALAELGAFPADDLLQLRQLGSPLEGHPNARRLPWVEASTGSLGQGLSIGLGMALAARLQGRDYRTWVLLGDGELDEGQVWEAAMAAAKYRAGGLTAIVDRNGYQQTGAGDAVLPLEPLADKWRACGWDCRELDGHDWSAVLEALAEAAAPRERPLVLVARTVKGFGVRRMVQDPGNKFHGVPLLGQEAEDAVREVMQG